MPRKFPGYIFAIPAKAIVVLKVISAGIEASPFRGIVALRPRNRKAAVGGLVWAALVLLPAAARAQGTPAQLTDPHGDNPFGSYQMSDIDQIAFANGSLDVRIPLFAHAGRGLGHQKFFHYTSKAWFPDSGPPCDSSVLQCPPPVPSVWRNSDNGMIFSYSTFYPSPCGNGGFGLAQEFGNFTYVDEAGTPHSFNAVTSPLSPPPSCIPIKLHGYATDGSGMAMDVTDFAHPVVTLKDGTQVRGADRGIPAFLRRDSNGNMITVDGNVSTGAVNGEFDTLGRDIRYVITKLANNASYEDWIAKDSSGNDQRARIEWVYLPVNTNFQQAGVDESGGSLRLASKVDLPNGLAYRFTYDTGTTPGHYGELLRIDLPLGGYVRYEYAPLAADHAEVRVVTRRAVSADGTAASEKAWTYGYQLATPDGFHSTTVVTDPDGNQTAHVTVTAANNSLANMIPVETEVRSYQGPAAAGRLLRTVKTDYTSITLAMGDGSMRPVLSRPIRVTTVLDNGLASKVETDYDAGPDNNGEISYNRSNVVEKREYDYGQGSAGPLLRRTTYTYLHNSNSAYANANIVDRVLNTAVYDGLGNLMAQTQNIYDGTTLANTNTSGNCQTPSGAPNHDYCGFGTGNLVRGNLTSARHWRNTDEVWLTTNFSYDDLGNLVSSTDPGQNATRYSHSDSWSGVGCVPAGVNTYAFLTQITNALDFRAQASYYSCPGLMQSRREESDIRAALAGSVFTYDSMDRLLTAKDSKGGQASYDYHGDALPLTVTRTGLITSSLSVSHSVLYDGAGRAKTSSLDSDPAGADVVDTTYDNLGRASTVSNAHRSTLSTTDGVTQTHFDALGRVRQITKQDGGISTVSYSGNCTTTGDEAGKLRRACTDALGRLIEVDEPGTVPVQNNYATMQADGNFVVYNQGGAALWSTGTAGTGSSPLEIQDDGNVVLYTFKWQAGTYATPSPGPFPAQACSIGTSLNAPQILPSNKCITSPKGQYMLWIAPDGTIMIYDLAHSVATWVPGGGGHPGAYGAMQADGNFVLYTADGQQALWSSGTSGTNSEKLEMEDDGRIIISRSTWNSGTSNGQFGGSPLPHPGCDVGFGVGTTGMLQPGQCLVSPNGRFELLLQGDGDLALYDLSATPQRFLWSAGTALSPVDPSVALRTLYSYDALGNLLCVEQHGDAAGSGCSADPSQDAASPWRVRRSTYDSLSRLLTTKNPESGTISYSYDANGNLLSKTSPAANQPAGSTLTTTVSYCYDALNRITGKAYSAQTCQNGQLPPGTAVVSYSYDSGANGIGRLTSLTDQAGSGNYSYDILGRMSSEQRTIAGVTRSMSYTYNLDGSVASVTYPSGATITYTPDSAGRVISAVDQDNSINYVTGGKYNSTNALTDSIYGYSSGGFSGIINSFSYNNRLQPVTLWSSSPVRTLMYLVYDFHLGGGDNGNVWGITNNRDTTRSQSFTYDALNRLISAQNAGTDCSVKLPGGATKFWGNSYGYDAWGNLLGKTPTKCSAENLSVTVNVNNQLQGGYTYDAAGNMTHDATASLDYGYDPENRIKGAAGFVYSYDADGNRVEKASGTTGTLYWYMTPGIVAESDLAGNLKSEYVFFNGERVARKDFPGNAVSYYFSDHLKTASVITDAVGNIKSESDYSPWGRELSFLSNDSNPYKFGGHERDQETGCDYFGARHYCNSLSRFLTPDWSAAPVPVPYADLTNPQSLNLYGYVGGNPASKADPDGHCCDLSGVIDFTVGIINAWGTDNAAGIGRVNEGNLAYHLGQVVGDGAAVIQGTVEVAVGGAGEVGGTGLIFTGVGAPAGVAIDVGSAAVIAHGGATGLTGAAHLGKAIVTAFSGRASDFSKSDKKQIDTANAAKNDGKNVCEKCGTETPPAQKSQKGVRPPNNERHRDHIKPVSQGGSKDPNANGQILCRKCNLDKSDK